jgi:putative two-component system response regulator
MDETATVLFVDDEPGVLKAARRLFFDCDITVLTADRGSRALELLKNSPVSVIITDNLMPGMTGIEFLQRAKVLSPDSMRIMMTAHADLRAAVDAINKGEVLRFVIKPWENEQFKTIIISSIDRYKMVRSMRKADEYALYSIAQTIELKDPYTRGHCDRVASYASSIAEALGIEAKTGEDIRHGSWLHDCGKIGVPEVILNYGGDLSPEEIRVIRNHPSWGAEVARLAHLPDSVVNIILYHHERYDGTGYPMGLKGNDIPLEARIVSAADMYDALTSDRPYRKGTTKVKAISILEKGKGSQLDPKIVDTLVRILRSKPTAALRET